jgi:hypothetical protein
MRVARAAHGRSRAGRAHDFPSLTTGPGRLSPPPPGSVTLPRAVRNQTSVRAPRSPRSTGPRAERVAQRGEQRTGGRRRGVASRGACGSHPRTSQRCAADSMAARGSATCAGATLRQRDAIGELELAPRAIRSPSRAERRRQQARSPRAEEAGENLERDHRTAYNAIPIAPTMPHEYLIDVHVHLDDYRAETRRTCSRKWATWVGPRGGHHLPEARSGPAERPGAARRARRAAAHHARRRMAHPLLVDDVAVDHPDVKFVPPPDEPTS